MKKSKELWARMGAWVEENGLIEDGGAKLKEFCAFFSIDSETHYRWLSIAEYADIITRARETFRANLEIDIVRSLAKAAKGYSFKSKHKKTIIEDNGHGKPQIRGEQQWEKEVNVEPNVQAATFLLSNLNAEKWRRTDRHEVNVSADKGFTIVVNNEEDAKILEQIADE